MATRSDSFERTDSSSLGSDWTEDSGDWAIASGNVRQNTTGDSYRKLRWTGAAMDSNNYSVEVVARSADSYHGIGPAARCAGSSAVTYYAYLIFGGDSAYLVEITAGAETILDTGSSITAATNYTLRLEVDGSTIRGYLNGVLDVSATDTSLSSGAPGTAAYGGNSTGTYITTWTAIDLASGTTYNQSAAGSVTPSGANVRRTAKTPAGSLAPAGAASKRTAKTPAGSVAPSGATSKRTGKGLAGSVGLAGALAAVRTALASVGGSLAPAGTVARSTGKGLAGSVGLAGTLARSTAKQLAGSLALAGTLATQLVGGVIEQAVGGTLALTGTLARATRVTVSGAIAPAGSIARRIAKTLAGALGLAGSVVTSWISPSAPKLDVTIGDAAQTALVIVDARWTVADVVDGAQTTLAIGDSAV